MDRVIDEQHFFEYPKIPSSKPHSVKSSESHYAFLYEEGVSETTEIMQAQSEPQSHEEILSESECSAVMNAASADSSSSEASVIDAMQKICIELKRTIKSQEDLFYDYALKILTKLASQFFKSEMVRQPDQFSKLIQELKSKLSIQDQPIQIFVSQAMFEKLQTCFVQVDCQLKVDAELAGADFYIKTPSALIDGQLEKLIEELFLGFKSC